MKLCHCPVGYCSSKYCCHKRHVDNSKPRAHERKDLKIDIARLGPLGAHKSRVIHRAVKDSDIGGNRKGPTNNKASILSVATIVVSVFCDILWLSGRVGSPMSSVCNGQRPWNCRAYEEGGQAQDDQAPTVHGHSKDLRRRFFEKLNYLKALSDCMTSCISPSPGDTVSDALFMPFSDPNSRLE